MNDSKHAARTALESAGFAVTIGAPRRSTRDHVDAFIDVRSGARIIAQRTVRAEPRDIANEINAELARVLKSEIDLVRGMAENARFRMNSAADDLARAEARAAQLGDAERPEAVTSDRAAARR